MKRSNASKRSSLQYLATTLSMSFEVAPVDKSLMTELALWESLKHVMFGVNGLCAKHRVSMSNRAMPSELCCIICMKIAQSTENGVNVGHWTCSTEASDTFAIHQTEMKQLLDIMQMRPVLLMYYVMLCHELKSLSDRPKETVSGLPQPGRAVEKQMYESVPKNRHDHPALVEPWNKRIWKICSVQGA